MLNKHKENVYVYQRMWQTHLNTGKWSKEASDSKEGSDILYILYFLTGNPTVFKAVNMLKYVGGNNSVLHIK